MVTNSVGFILPKSLSMQVKADRQLEKLLSEDENKKSGEHQELEAALEVAVEWTNLEAIGELLARAEAVEDAESFMATSDVVKKAKELVAKTESIAKVLQTALTSRNSKVFFLRYDSPPPRFSPRRS